MMSPPSPLPFPFRREASSTTPDELSGGGTMATSFEHPTQDSLDSGKVSAEKPAIKKPLQSPKPILNALKNLLPQGKKGGTAQSASTFSFPEKAPSSSTVPTAHIGHQALVHEVLKQAPPTGIQITLEWVNAQEVMAQYTSEPLTQSLSLQTLQKELFQHIHQFLQQGLEEHIAQFPILQGMQCQAVPTYTTIPLLALQWTHLQHLQDAVYVALKTCLTLLNKPLKIQGIPILLRGGADLLHLNKESQMDPFATVHERQLAPLSGMCVSQAIVSLLGITTAHFELEEVPTESLVNLMNTTTQGIPTAGITPIWFVRLSMQQPQAQETRESHQAPIQIEGLWEETSSSASSHPPEPTVHVPTLTPNVDPPMTQAITPSVYPSQPQYDTPEAFQVAHPSSVEVHEDVSHTNAHHTDSLTAQDPSHEVAHLKPSSSLHPIAPQDTSTLFPTAKPCHAHASLPPVEALPTTTTRPAIATETADSIKIAHPWLEVFHTWLTHYHAPSEARFNAKKDPTAPSSLPWAWYKNHPIQPSVHANSKLHREDLSLAELAHWLEHSWLQPMLQKSERTTPRLLLSGAKGTGKTQLLQVLKTASEQWGISQTSQETSRTQLQWLHVQGRTRYYAPKTQHPLELPVPFSFLQEWLLQWLGLPVDSIPFEMLAQRIDAVIQHLFTSPSTGGEHSALAQRVRGYFERCLMIQDPEPVTTLIQRWHQDKPETLTGSMPSQVEQGIWFKLLAELMPLLRRYGSVVWVLDDAQVIDSASHEVLEALMCHTQEDPNIYWCLVLEQPSHTTSVPTMWHQTLEKLGYGAWKHFHLRKPSAIELKWMFQQSTFGLRIAPPDRAFQMLHALLPEEGVYFWQEEVFRYLQELHYLQPEGIHTQDTPAQETVFSEASTIEQAQQLPLVPAGEFTWDRLPQILPLTKVSAPASSVATPHIHVVDSRILLERMERLTMPQQELLRWLAMAGGVVSMPALSQLMQIEEASLQTLLETLWSLGWVIPDASGNITFRHGIQHTFVYEQIPPSVMKQAHEVMLRYFKFALKHHHVCDYALLLEQAGLTHDWDSTCHALVGLSVRFTSQLEQPSALLPLLQAFMKEAQQSTWKPSPQAFSTWYGDLQWLFIHVLALHAPHEALPILETLQHHYETSHIPAQQGLSSEPSQGDSSTSLGFTSLELHLFQVQLYSTLGQAFQAASLLEQLPIPEEPLNQWETLPTLSEKVGYYLDAGYVGTATSMIHIQMFPLLFQWRDMAMSHEERQAIEMVHLFLRWKQAWCYATMNGSPKLTVHAQASLHEQLQHMYQALESQAPHTWLGAGAMHYQWVRMGLLMGEVSKAKHVLGILKHKLTQYPQETLWVYEALAQFALLQHQASHFMWHIKLNTLSDPQEVYTITGIEPFSLEAFSQWEERIASHSLYLWQQVLPLMSTPLGVGLFYEAVYLMLEAWLTWIEAMVSLYRQSSETSMAPMPIETIMQHSLESLSLLDSLRQEAQALGLVGWWSEWETLSLRLKLIGMQAGWGHPQFSTDSASWHTWHQGLQRLDSLITREDISHHAKHILLQVLKAEALFMQQQWIEGGKVLEETWKTLKRLEAQEEKGAITRWSALRASWLITRLYTHLHESATTLAQKEHYNQKRDRLMQEFITRATTCLAV
ncbi:MAG: AAA family ATPase [Vampirovibrionales bacterium]